MDFLKCMQEEGADEPPRCKPFVDDYRECLHHRKFWERRLAMDKERRRQEGKKKKASEGLFLSSP